MWAIDGTWKRVFAALLAGADVEGDLDWVVGVDSTMVRAHQHAAGPVKRGVPVGEPHDHALGRSGGGLTTKIHPAADGRCRPLAFVLTPGRAGALPPSRRAYSSRAIREHLRNDKRPRSAARTSQKARGTTHVPARGSRGSMVP